MNANLCGNYKFLKLGLLKNPVGIRILYLVFLIQFISKKIFKDYNKSFKTLYFFINKDDNASKNKD